MRFQRFGRRLQVRIESGEHVLEPLVELCRREGVGYGVVNGLGAVRWVRLAYLNGETREYEMHEVTEQLEVVSLIGNVTQRDDAPFLHLHVSLGRRDLSMLGGHFLDAIADPTLEVSIQPEEGTIVRRMDPDLGMAVMDLPERR